MQAFLSGTEPEPFVQPGGVKKVNACTASNAGYQEFFINGTEPEKNCRTTAPAPQQTDDDEPEEVVKDTDGDGVPDDKDKCPTQGGATVDADGCPKPDPATTDTDGDGVPDRSDKCAGTAAGEEVDNQGCAIVDTDGDGVPDEQDECPAIGGLVGEDGCPRDAPGQGGGDTDPEPTPESGYIRRSYA